MPLNLNEEYIWLVTDQRVPYLLIENQLIVRSTFSALVAEIAGQYRRVRNDGNAYTFLVKALDDDGVEIILALKEPSLLALLILADITIGIDAVGVDYPARIMSKIMAMATTSLASFSNLHAVEDIQPKRFCFQVSMPSQ